ncbi:MAG: hypothetical protein J5849_06525 [Clostridia bacterium]|nr:hypothetical protein [Clostridia bacterium]
MRLFFYYALHSFKNQLRKLFKTWVFVFIAVCAVMGILIGIGTGFLMDAADDAGEELPPEQIEELLPGLHTEDEEEDGEDEAIEITVKAPETGKLALVELIAGGVILLIFVWEALGADRNGSKIFLPADVNLLFPSPMKPQSVLFFRLMTQIGAMIFASFYLIFQLPNLILNVGLSFPAALAILAAWLLTVIFAKLIAVFLYTVASTHPAVKPRLRIAIYALLGLLAAGVLLVWRGGNVSWLEALEKFFNAPGTRLIPIWGWIKGFVMYAAEGEYLRSGLFLLLTLAGGGLMLFLIWRVKADFYEDAMAKSEETAALQEKARDSRSGIVFGKKKGKDRSDSLRRDGLRHGEGANVFFFKSLYNRFRFAKFGFLTKTCGVYLAGAILTAAVCRFGLSFRNIIPTAALMALFAFYRSLGNPLEEDTKTDFFVLIPENTWAKLFWSLLAGAVNCLLDLLPAMAAALLILWCDPLPAIPWIVFIVTVDLYATTVGAFINLSVPVSAGKTIKQMVQILFLYFGVVPGAGMIAVGLILGGEWIGMLAVLGASLFHLAFAGLFFALTPLFIGPFGSRAR